MTEDLIQVVCGQCSGQMRVERTGEAVVCPHCESHLRVPPSAKSGAVLHVETGSGVLDRGRTGESSAIGGGTVGEGISRRVVLLVASYASAVTIAFVWMLFQNSSSDPLESLPDIRPLNEDEFHFVGFNEELPEGHTLRLGETRRFGDVNITPVRVTRTPIEFAHYLDRDAKRDPTGPVLKLWLKFENVAEDVAFPPYGSSLMSHRSPMPNEPDKFMVNSFLAPVSMNPRTAESVLLNYEHPDFSEWNISRQPRTPLPPGEEYSTFVACSEFGTETAMKEAEDLVWRVQIRKGIHRESRHGVTTLVDVVFSPSAVENSEPPAPAAEPQQDDEERAGGTG